MDLEVLTSKSIVAVKISMKMKSKLIVNANAGVLVEINDVSVAV